MAPEAILGRSGTEWARGCSGAKPLGQEPLDAASEVETVDACAIQPKSEASADDVLEAIPGEEKVRTVSALQMIPAEAADDDVVSDASADRVRIRPALSSARRKRP